MGKVLLTWCIGCAAMYPAQYSAVYGLSQFDLKDAS